MVVNRKDVPRCSCVQVVRSKDRRKNGKVRYEFCRLSEVVLLG